MQTIEEYRKNNPKAATMSDEGLSRYVYKKFGPPPGTNATFEEFDKLFRPDTGGSEGNLGKTAHLAGRGFMSAPLQLASSLFGAVAPKEGKLHDIAEELNMLVGEEQRQMKEVTDSMGGVAGHLGEAAHGLAALPFNLTTDIAAGGAIKGVLPAKLGMNKLAPFAYGMGARRAAAGSAESGLEGGSIPERLMHATRGGALGLAEGQLMHKMTGAVHGLEKGRLLKGALNTAGFSALGAASAATDSISKGEMPDPEKMKHAAIQGGLMGAAFAVPGLASAGFEVGTKTGKKVIRGLTERDTVITEAAMKQWVEETGEMPEVVEETDTGLVIKAGKYKTEITFVDTPMSEVEISDYVPDQRNVRVTKTHLGRPLDAKVTFGKPLDMTPPTEMPGPTTEPGHMGESAPLPTTSPGGKVPARRSSWVPETEMDPRSEGTAGKPVLQAPKPVKLKTEVAGREVADIEEFRKIVQERYGKKEAGQEQLTLFQKNDPIETGPAATNRRTQAKKDHIKFVVDAAFRNGDIKTGDHVRTTTAADLYHILKHGTVRIGTNMEGQSGISAYEMKGPSSPGEMAVMGPYSDALADHPVAIIFPENAKVGYGNGVNETLMHPDTSPTELRYVIAGEPKIYKAHELEQGLRDLVTKHKAQKLQFLQEHGDLDLDTQSFLDTFLPNPQPHEYGPIGGRKGFYDMTLKTWGLNNPKAKAVLKVTDMIGKVWVKDQARAGRPDLGLEHFYEETAAGGIIVKGLEGMEGVPRGAVKIMNDGRAVYMALNQPDISTALHEIGHVAKFHVANGMDMALLERVYNVRNGDWRGDPEENYAMDVERFFLNGEVENPELRPVFEKISRWIKDIYKESAEMEGVVDPDLAKVMNRWLGEELEFSEAADHIEMIHRQSGVESEGEYYGSTFNVSRGKNMIGHDAIAVGVFPELSRTVEGHPTAAQIEAFILDNKEILSDPRFNVGTWYEKATNETTLDISLNIPEEWKAIAVAKELNQKATFNLRTKEEIPTGGTGDFLGESTSPLTILDELSTAKPLRLVRYMNDPNITYADPQNEAHRTGIKGQEKNRVMDNPDSPNRLHYYVEGGPEEPHVAQKPHKYVTTVPDEKIYNWSADKRGYREQSVRDGMATYDVDYAESLMKEDGYWGYVAPDGPHPSTVVVFEGLPVKEHSAHRAMQLLRDMDIDTDTVSIRTLTPEQIELYGQKYGVEGMGPITPVEEIAYDGGSILVPGGLQGKFTWLDLNFFKSQAIDPNTVPEWLHARIQEKLARTMMPEPGDTMQVYNNVLFGMLSQGTHLTPNELAYSRVRARDMEGVKEMAMFAEELPPNPTEKQRKVVDAKMRKFYGINKLKDGGIGYGGSMSLSRLADFADLFTKNPEFFMIKEGENWFDFTDRISSQVGGIKTKLAAFGGVWQDPLHAAIGAADRHIIRRVMEKSFSTKKERNAFNKRMIDKWNTEETKTPRRKIAYKEGFDAILDEKGGQSFYANFMAKEFLPKSIKLRLANGEINPRVPEHFRNVEWIEEPTHVLVANERYRNAIKEIERLAKPRNLGIFANQWMEWDRERGRFEPHEVMYPGLYKLPKQPVHETMISRNAHWEAGWLKNRGPVRPLKQTAMGEGNEPWNRMLYFQEGPPKDIKQLVKQPAEVIEGRLRTELEKLGQDEFNHRYNEGQVLGLVAKDLADSKGISMTDAKMFLTREAAKYRAVYNKVANDAETQRHALAQGLVPGQKESPRDLMFQEQRKVSKKERRVQAEMKAHRQTLREAPFAPEDQNTGPLATYEKFIDNTVGEKLIRERITPWLEEIPVLGEAVKKGRRFFDRNYRGDMAQSKEYVEAIDAKVQKQNLGREWAMMLGNKLVDFSEQSQLQIGDALRGRRTMESLPTKERMAAQEAQQALYALGKKAAELGLLSEEVFFKNAGKYLPRLYSKFEFQRLQTLYGKAPGKMEFSRFLKRQDIPEELRKEYGEILTPGYPVAKGIMQLTHDIEQAQWFQKIAQNPEWAVPQKQKVYKQGNRTVRENIDLPPEVQAELQEKGFVQLTNNKKLGALANAWVHPEIHKELSQITQPVSEITKSARKALGAWKFGKVILSPKTHMRNIVSNSMLAHLGGMPLYEQGPYIARAWQELGGKPTEYFKAAHKFGLVDAGWQKGELEGIAEKSFILDKPSAGSEFGATELMGKAADWYFHNKGSKKMAEWYEKSEQVFKVAKMIHNVERRGMDIEAAARDAEKWLFNYGKLSEGQHRYKNAWYGAPFATFSFKALPRVFEAAVKTPWRFILPIGMMKGLQMGAQELIGDTDEEFEAKKKMRPDWMQPQGPLAKAMDLVGLSNFARVGIQDKDNREYWLNLTYMMPWGDIGEGGGLLGIPGALMPGTQPGVKDAFQQISNYDIFWKDNIVKEEDLAGKEGLDRTVANLTARGENLAHSLLPTPILDTNKILSAIKGEPDYRGRMKSGVSVVGDVLFGLKTYPVDYVEQIERRAMELDPKTGRHARRIKSKLKSLYNKQDAMSRLGKPSDYYNAEIEALFEQLDGLDKQLSEWEQTFSKTGM